MAKEDLRIEVYDRRLRRKAFVGDLVTATLTPRYNAQGTGSITVRADARSINHLLADGARVRVTYYGRHLLGGPVWGARGSVTQGGTITLQIRDYWMLMATPAYPAPSQTIQAQSLTDPAQSPVIGATEEGTTKGHGAYYLWGSPTSRESAVKGIIRANLATRLGLPVVTAPNLGRGGAPLNLPRVRMASLEEATQQLLAEAGLGLVFWNEHPDEQINVDVFQPRTRPWKLTAESGVVVSGEWAMNPPEATRAIVGGPGELAARVFRPVVNGPLETRLGLALEVFKEATGGSLEWPEDLAEKYEVAKYYLRRGDVAAQDKADLIAALDAAGDKALSDGAPTSSLSVELAEVGPFKFGTDKGFWLGDPVTIMAQGIPFTDRILAVSITVTDQGVFTVTPQVGNRDDDPTIKLAKAVAALATSQRRVAASR